MRTRVIIIVLGLFTVYSSLQAQGNRIWHEAHYFDSLQQSSSGLWGSFAYDLRSNTLSNQLLNEALFDQAIQKSTADPLIDLPNDGTTRLQGGVQGELWYRMKREKGPNFLFGFEVYDMLYGVFSNGLAQLYLNGNGPYEDMTLPLGPSRFNYFSNQSVGMGLEWSNEHRTFGGNLNLVKSSRYQQLEVTESSSLYTAPYGAQLEGQLELDYRTSSTQQPKAGAWYGTGASSDFYLILHPEDGESTISFQAGNIGFVHFGGSRVYELNRDSTFSGVEIDNILAIEDELSTSGNLDSLEALVGLRQSSQSSAVALPAFFQFDYTQKLSSKLSFAFQLRQVFFVGLPQARVGLAWSAAQWLSVEPFARFGGFSRVDVGLTAAIKVKQQFNLLVKYELLESQFAPSQSTSQGLFIAGLIRF